MLTRAPGIIAAAWLALTGVSACAKIEAPPGGPPDLVPPRLVSASPESLAVLSGFDGDVVFRYDEVISEGGAPSSGNGTSELERLILLSPTTRPPTVRWHRDRITVRPREGWQPDRVYRIELLPGVTDLRSNRETSGGAVVTFSTGAPIPTRTLSGAVTDWTNGRPAPAALIEAVHAGDSLVYRTHADSAGKFRLGPIPDGAYVVFGSIDQNRNLQRDARESFDSTAVAAGVSEAGTLWTFQHDTVGPRIQGITVNDSSSAAVTFALPVDPYQRLDSTAVSVRMLPDSTPVAVRSILPQTAYDSAFGHRNAPPTMADSAAGRLPPPPPPRAIPRRPAAGDSATRAPADTLPVRPTLYTRLIVRIRDSWKPGGRYTVEIRGIRNPNGAAATARGAFIVPELPKLPPVTDSTSHGANGDYSRIRPPARDSLRADSSSRGVRRPSRQ